MINVQKLRLVISNLFAVECLTSNADDIIAEYSHLNVTGDDILRASTIRELISRPNSRTVRSVGSIDHNRDPVLLAYDIAYAYVGKFGLKHQYDLYLQRLSKWGDFTEKHPEYELSMRAVFEYVLKSVEDEAMAVGDEVPLEFRRESFIYERLKDLAVFGRNVLVLYRELLRPYDIIPADETLNDGHFNRLLVRFLREEG